MNPIPVQSTERFRTVEVQGSLSCALTLDQRMFCWGDGLTTPTAVLPTLRFTALSGHCALATDGVPYCRNYQGVLVRRGDGVLVRSLSSGQYYECGIRVDGILVCWGYNYYGQLGSGDVDDRIPPAPVVGQ